MVSSRARQMWSGCPWHSRSLASLPNGGRCRGEGSAGRRNPSTSLGGGNPGVPKQPPATRICKQILGAHAKMPIPQPSQGGWDRAQQSTPNLRPWAALALQGPSQPVSGSQALCSGPPCRGPLPVLLVLGSHPLTGPPWVLSYRGPASSQPGGLGPSPSPSSLSSIVHPPQSPQSPWHLSPHH